MFVKIKIVQPHHEYPLAYLHIEVSSDMRFGEQRADQLENILGDHSIFIIGRWEVSVNPDGSENLRAPVLLENEYVNQTQ